MQSTDPEIWRPVVGYEGLYEVSDHGRIRSMPRIDPRGQHRPSIIRKPVLTSRGHHAIRLHRDREATTRPVSHHVLEAFVGPRPDGTEAIYLDADRTNTSLPNLKWGRKNERPDQYNPKPCLIPGCPRKVKARGHCEPHDRRIRLYGDPLASAPKVSAQDRFWSRVQPTGFCWEWVAGHDSNGYGVFNPSKGDSRRAHRVAYEYLVGPIPDGLHIDHLCRNRNCVNPDHLEPVTVAENSRRESAIRRLGK